MAVVTHSRIAMECKSLASIVVVLGSEIEMGKYKTPKIRKDNDH